MSAANNPRFVDLLKKPVHLIAFGGGAGLAPKAPGTFGTLVALPIYLMLQPLDLVFYLLIVAVLALLGVWFCEKTATDLAVHDHSGIVWDEIVGYLITLTALPLSAFNIIVGFIVFRFFDIVKPWPISWLDRHVKGGFGIMVDDVLAGVFAAIVLQLLNVYL